MLLRLAQQRSMARNRISIQELAPTAARTLCVAAALTCAMSASSPRISGPFRANAPSDRAIFKAIRSQDPAISRAAYRSWKLRHDVFVGDLVSYASDPAPRVPRAPQRVAVKILADMRSRALVPILMNYVDWRSERADADAQLAEEHPCKVALCRMGLSCVPCLLQRMTAITSHELSDEEIDRRAALLDDIFRHSRFAGSQSYIGIAFVEINVSGRPNRNTEAVKRLLDRLRSRARQPAHVNGASGPDRANSEASAVPPSRPSALVRANGLDVAQDNVIGALESCDPERLAEAYSAWAEARREYGESLLWIAGGHLKKAHEVERRLAIEMLGDMRFSEAVPLLLRDIDWEYQEPVNDCDPLAGRPCAQALVKFGIAVIPEMMEWLARDENVMISDGALDIHARIITKLCGVSAQSEGGGPDAAVAMVAAFTSYHRSSQNCQRLLAALKQPRPAHALKAAKRN